VAKGHKPLAIRIIFSTNMLSFHNVYTVGLFT